jgi:hypothetical protein
MAYRGYKAYRFLKSSGVFGKALSRTRPFGERSMLFGDVHRGAPSPGLLNNGNRFALGWSARSSRSVGLGQGLARQVFRAKIFGKHVTILRGRWLS